MSVMRSHSFGEQVLYVNCYTAGLGAGSSIVLPGHSHLYVVASLSADGRRLSEGEDGLPISLTTPLDADVEAGAEVTVAAPPSAPPLRPAVTEKDPHLLFAHGGRADFRGRNGAIYAFFSAPGLGVNVKTEDATFTLNGGKLTVDGSFITEAHVTARVGGRKRKWANFSYWASELNEFNTGWTFINGTCGGARGSGSFQFGLAGQKRCEELEVHTTFSTATCTVGNWTVTIRGNHVFNWISGPAHRLDLAFGGRGDWASRLRPHGIIGQSFSSLSPRHGKTDEYPSAGRVRTSAMAEGAIDGEAAMYEVAGPHGTVFPFSRFDAPADAPQLAAPGALGGDATAA